MLLSQKKKSKTNLIRKQRRVDVDRNTRMFAWTTCCRPKSQLS